MGINSVNMGAGVFSTAFALIAEGVRRNRIGLLASLDLNLGDALSTHVGLAGGLPEGNPVPAALIESGGELAWVGTKFALLAVVILLVCLLGRRYPRLWHTFTVTNVVLLAALIANSAQILAR